MRLQVRLCQQLLVGPTGEVALGLDVPAPPDQDAEVVGGVAAVAWVHTSAPCFPGTPCLVESVPLLELDDGLRMNASVAGTRKPDALHYPFVDPFAYGL